MRAMANLMSCRWVKSLLDAGTRARGLDIRSQPTPGAERWNAQPRHSRLSCWCLQQHDHREMGIIHSTMTGAEDSPAC